MSDAGSGSLNGHPELSERERQVLQYMANGRSNKEIGQVVYISENTVKAHVKSILTKLARCNGPHGSYSTDRAAHPISATRKISPKRIRIPDPTLLEAYATLRSGCYYPSAGFRAEINALHMNKVEEKGGEELHECPALEFLALTGLCLLIILSGVCVVLQI